MKKTDNIRAVISYDWTAPVRNAIEDSSERCKFWEFVFAYQFEQNFGVPNCEELPNTPESRLSWNYLKPQIDSMCNKYAEMVERNRKNGRANAKSDTEPTGAAGSDTEPTGDNKRKENKSKVNKSQVNQASASAREGMDGNFYFEFGCNLLRKGYICPRQEINEFMQYVQQNKVKDPVKLAQTWEPNESGKRLDPSRGGRIADFLEGVTAYDIEILCEIINVQYYEDHIIVSPANLQVWEKLREKVECKKCANIWLQGRKVWHDLKE